MKKKSLEYAGSAPFSIGENLKSLRHSRKLSLDELGSASGVSKAMLSQIESGKVNPTVATVWKIAQAFQVDFNVLLKGAGEKIPFFQVCRRDDLTLLDTQSRGVSIKVLSPPSHANDLELYLLEFEPGAVLESQAHATGSEEFLTVLSGELHLSAGSRNAVLREGDGAVYDCDVVHKLFNASKVPAKGHLTVRFRKA